MSFIIGVDIGGTYIKTAILNNKGDTISKTQTETGNKKTPSDVIQRTTMSIETIIQNNNIKKKNIIGIGVGCPGQLSSVTGIVESSPNMKNWKKVPLRQTLSGNLSLPVEIFNDANAAAWGEFWLGAGRKTSTFILYTLGTGIGGGIILNRQLYTGIDECAGELGHTTVILDGPKCGCGNHGCIETLASASRLVKIVQDKIKNGVKTTLKKDYTSNTLSAKSIYLAAKKGDPFAKEMLSNTGRYLGIAAASIINTLNPEVIAYGGGLSNAGNLLFSSLRSEAKKRSLAVPFNRVKIVKASLGNDAGFLGAAGLFLDKHRNQ